VAASTGNPVVRPVGREPRPGPQKIERLRAASAMRRAQPGARRSGNFFTPAQALPARFGAPRPPGMAFLLAAVRSRGGMELCPRNVQEPNGLLPLSPSRLVPKSKLIAGRRGRHNKRRTFDGS